MFERRLKIIVAVLVSVSIVLFGRVFGMQVFGHSYWTQQATGLLVKPTLTETMRGKIYDFRGQLLAEDTACTDACVDYRAILEPPDPAWVRSVAIDHLTKRMGSDFKKLHGNKRKAAVDAEVQPVRDQLQTMWSVLATFYHSTDVPASPSSPTTQPVDIDEAPKIDPEAAITGLRRDIVQVVQARRKALIARSRARNDAKSSALMRWIFSDADTATASAGDDLVIEDQQQPHVILHALDSDACNFLGKHLDEFPGLVLRPSTHRYYPMRTVAAHLMGRISRVAAGDLPPPAKMDPNDLRRYLPNDTIGRDGIEALCEPLLRGTRGQIEKQLDGTVIGETPFQPGADVHLSIDAALQQKVQEMLQHVEIKADGKYITPPGGVSMHAAAVVLDVPTNEVRVLASNPGFDLNDMETRLDVLMHDTPNEPMRDRATSDEFVPGSTVKPLIGLGAMTQGMIRVDETVECTGILYLPEVGPDGRVRKVRMEGGRCWVVSELGAKLKKLGIDPKHHPVPLDAPHPTGFLTFADALERSCDIYFETVADRLGIDGVNYWYDRFGLGRITGIGIYERPGLRSAQWHRPLPRNTSARMNNCLSGMGEGTAWATPLQIANEAATIAREGVWMRPRLLTAETQSELDAVHPRPSTGVPDRVDLHLNTDALREAKIGMRNVAHGAAGTGRFEDPLPGWLTIAAKTGTADTSKLEVWTTDPQGNRKKVLRTPVYRDGPETDTPWYRSEKGSEVIAWYMGFAPLDHPKIAFCVMVEYPGAGGGPVSGPIVRKIIDECMKAGYFPEAPAISTARPAFRISP